ncbi:DUF6234 family protein [Streptomyces sp. NPDC050392]|uniref:DUF6234 family protein n=1 Tax=Streptomyces sp. NPDC050392 TaxID=3155782 RepID=UPI00341F96B2
MWRAKPSTGQQVGLSVALLLIDLVAVAYLVFRYGMTGWADAYDSNNPPGAPSEAIRGAWLLLGGAAVTGGGLILLRWQISGIVQLLVLGTGAGLLAALATVK